MITYIILPAMGTVYFSHWVPEGVVYIPELDSDWSTYILFDISWRDCRM